MRIMHIAHLLRKYNPDEWGGTETALKQLISNLNAREMAGSIYCPRCPPYSGGDPLAQTGWPIHRFHAFLPIAGLSDEQKKAHWAVGGNIMSFDAAWKLWKEPGLSLIHTHTCNRLGGVALTAAKARNLPLVVSIHGGFLDLPPALEAQIQASQERGWEWGKIFGWIVGARKVLQEADAILTVNPKEAQLLNERYPNKRIIYQPHSICVDSYQTDHRDTAYRMFPQLIKRKVLLILGRIDPIKNPAWAAHQLPALLRQDPEITLVFAGPATDASYAQELQKWLKEHRLLDHCLFTNALPTESPQLTGLLQLADLLLLPSQSETFGLVILEAWAAGTATIASRTTGAANLIEHEKNGWLFDLDKPESFHQLIVGLLKHPKKRQDAAASGLEVIKKNYDSSLIGGRICDLYQTLIEEKQR